MAPPPILRFSNPSTNLFDHVNFANYLSMADTTLKNFNITGHATNYINGAYHIAVSTYKANSRPLNAITSSNELEGVQVLNNAFMVNSHIYGNINKMNRLAYVNNGNYVGFDAMLNVDGVETGIIPVFFTHYCDSNSTTYNGEFIEWSFPFSVEPSSLGISGSYPPIESVLLGSDNGGTTWNFITMIYGNSTNIIVTAISTSSKYSRFKWVQLISHTFVRRLVMRHLTLYGDIWA
jgi:hypothetical protein